MPRQHQYFVYILTNWNDRVMYIGMTNNLERRIAEHRGRSISGFTQKYNVTKLVHFEITTDVTAALGREKELKRWRREKKNSLVYMHNAEWRDLSQDFSLQSK